MILRNFETRRMQASRPPRTLFARQLGNPLRFRYDRRIISLPQALAGIRNRVATQDDLTSLWDFLAIAAYVAAHLPGWQRSEDFGFIAERDGGPIGAAWARQFAPGEEPAFFVDERTPEITIGVRPYIRGRGVGEMLLHALIGEAARRGVGLCLNVRHDNPAQRLYERVGFRLVPGSGVPNRVGGTSFGMLWAAPR
jgi:ribosomal protein S18 acetylase RimI-like enzyme